MTGRPILLAGERLPPSPVQERSLVKRDRLHAAALAFFAERGYAATSVGDIASKAGLTTGGFYQHYRSKRQLLLVLVDDLLDRLSGTSLDLAPGANPRKAIATLLTSLFAIDLEFVGAYRAWRELVLIEPALAAVDADIRAWSGRRVLTVLEGLVALPRARRDLDLKGLAATFDGLFWDLLGRVPTMPRRELDKTLDVITHLICCGLFRDA